MDNTLIPNEMIEHILSDQTARRIIVKESHYWFFHLYFSEYVKYRTADFQREMFAITEDEQSNMAVIVAFRGSAKSTIMTMSYPLWAVLGKLQKKCVIIISQTQTQAKIHFENFKRELEGNNFLRSDLGPFQDKSKEWGSLSLFIPRFNAKIVAASTEQSIRGIRSGPYRPDLIILDDVEDINSVKTRENREKIHSWFRGEILPLGDKGTKFIVVGNLLHEDSLLMRLKNDIVNDPEVGTYKEYPFKTEDGTVMWPGKFTSEKEITEERRKIGDEKAWQREYMLKIIADEDQIVKKEWIKYYDELPKDHDKYRFTSIAADLAIAENSRADYTAIITAHVYGYRETLRVYILPNPVNERLDFPSTLTRINDIAEHCADENTRPTIFIEEVAYQTAAIQQLQKMGLAVKGFKVAGQDKRARLNSITNYIMQGKVLFPRNSSDILIQQLLYFGVEKHDDLVDAFTMLIHMVIKEDRPQVILMSKAALGLYPPGETGGYFSGHSDLDFRRGSRYF